MPITYPNFDEILQVPGFLYWGTVGLSHESEYGTLLGYTEDGVHFEPGINIVPVRQEETGEEITQIFYVGNAPTIYATLQNYNAAVLTKLFPGMGGVTYVKSPGSYLAGKQLSSTSSYTARLLFMPLDETNNPCLIFQKACPHIVETAKLNFMHNNRTFFPVVFRGLRKTSDAEGIYYLGNKMGAVLR